LEVGALCDLTSIDERSVRTAGSSPDQLWLAASAPDVLDTVVGGKHVMRARQHRLGAPGDLMVGAMARVDALLERTR
ncbi:MAG: formimidoylglutamate deiminase, partial [Cellulomonadaceae bacterium]|nr:formimidoylglutamate deiminase [Cellulomonadaceae bacterium]